MASKWDQQVPFIVDRDGTSVMLAYPDGWREPEWVQARMFTGSVTIDASFRGRSAANFEVTVTEPGRRPWRATMFMSGLMSAIRLADRVERVDGRLEFTGRWEMCKRGQNFGIGPIPSTRA